MAICSYICPIGAYSDWLSIEFPLLRARAHVQIIHCRKSVNPLRAGIRRAAPRQQMVPVWTQ
jgi:hypothetical protein